MCRVYLCVRCLFSLFAFQNNCCCFCGCIRRRALMTLTGREETPRSRGWKESNSFSRTKRVCVHLYLNVFVFGHLFLEVFSCFVTRYILYAAYNKDSDTVWTDMCVCHRSVCVCVCARVCMAVLLHRLTGECCKRMIRPGAHQGCSAITQGLWGIWSCSAFQGRLQLGSSPPRSPHTHHFNCLCFFHYFYCLSSALRAPWACGKVIVMAAVCS